MDSIRLPRRAFLTIIAGGLLAGPLDTEAQQADRIARIGLLTLNLAAPANPRVLESFLQGLRALGYVDGRNVRIEHRSADGKPERFPALAAELAALKVDIIVTAGGSLAALAAKRATTAIPIVFHAVGDPVEEGLVNSLARPGGNLTGLAVASPELVNKSLELLGQAVPGVSRVALLLKPDAVPERVKNARLKAANISARALGMRLQVVEARGPEDFDRAFSDMTRTRAEALSVMGTPVFDSQRQRLVTLAARNRLPTVYSFSTYVEAGGLMSYGPDIADLARRAATYVDKILKGAKPGDLPVEQPTKFELVINLKTAKALGLTVSPALLQRADQVIE
jgi:putative tryptophan/tyrosine transport system substrate-binding protein